MEQITWSKIKDFVNTLTPEQLEMKVMVATDGSVFKVLDLDIFDEDTIDSGEGFEPLSGYPSEDIDKTNDMIWEKGTPWIFADHFKG